MLDYFLLPDLKIDKDYFSNKVIHQSKYWGHFGTGRFKFYVGSPDNKTLDILDAIFQNAGDVIIQVAFNKVKSNHIIGPHVDYERGCTINIPICGDFYNSTLDYYEWSEPVTVISPSQSLDSAPESKFYPHSDIQSQISYTDPICFDTRVPHGVTNVTRQDRYILGCTFRMDLGIQDLKDMYDNKELLK
jgi:hypothetical protein